MQGRANPVLFQQIRRHDFIGSERGDNAAPIHQHDAVHGASQHIFQAVLHYDHGFPQIAVQPVNQLNSAPPRGRVQHRQGFVEQQNLDFIHQHPGHRHALFLAPGKFLGGVTEKLLHADDACRLPHSRRHLRRIHPLVLQRKGHVIRHRQPHELGRGILHHGTDFRGDLDQGGTRRVQTVDANRTGGLARVIVRNQTVQDSNQRGFAAARSPDDSDFFAGENLEVNFVQGRFGLGAVLETEIAQANHGLAPSRHPRRGRIHTVRISYGQNATSTHNYSASSTRKKPRPGTRRWGIRTR